MPLLQVLGDRPFRSHEVVRLSPEVSLTCEVQDDGSLVFLDEAGKPASECLVEQTKKQKRDALRGLSGS